MTAAMRFKQRLKTELDIYIGREITPELQGEISRKIEDLAREYNLPKPKGTIQNGLLSISLEQIHIDRGNHP